MNELQIFNNEEFGEIRTAVVNNEPMFCLSDICKSLGLSQPSKVKERLSEKGVRTIPTLTSGGEQNLLYINEPNLYKTIFQSRKESAERFTEWVTSEVLPSIRKTGSYNKPMTTAEQIQLLAQGNTELNERVDMVDGRVTDLENNMTIDYGQQVVIGDEVNKVVISALGGKNSRAYKEIGKKVFAECNHDLKHYFHVNSRNNVPKKRFEEAVQYIQNWRPCTNTQIMISDYNLQMKMCMEG